MRSTLQLVTLPNLRTLSLSRLSDAADGILALGEKASTAVGLSAKDFNAFAVQFAGFTKPVDDR
jgi:hypothetical protein